MLILLISFLNFKSTNIFGIYQSYLVGVIYLLICFFGIFVSIFPIKINIFKNIFFSSINKNNYSIHNVSANDFNCIIKSKIKGHHPECDFFSSHVFHIFGKTICSGCFGLSTGAIFSIILTIPYFLIGNIIFADSLILVYVGSILVIFSLITNNILTIDISLVRSLFSFILVFSTSILLIGIDGLIGNIFLDLYFLFLCIFIIYCRVLSSKNVHKHVCKSCKNYIHP